MSNGGGGGGGDRGGGNRGGRIGGGGGGSGRVTIPETVRKTILNIREITGKQHTDEDIYSVLRDCSMDPNETAQKLLYLDTFHEVKSKRERKKEIPGTQGRGPRGSQGNRSANPVYPDAVGRRNAAARRDNEVNHMKERGSSTLLPAVQKINGEAATKETKGSAVISNGSLTLPNGGSAPRHGHPKSTMEGSVSITKDTLVVDAKKPAKVGQVRAVPPSPPNQSAESVGQVQEGKMTPILNHIPTPVSASVNEAYSSTSEPVLVPSMTQHHGTVDEVELEVGSQQRTGGQNQMHGNKQLFPDAGAEFSKNEKASSIVINSLNQKNERSEPHSVEISELSASPQLSSLSTDDSSLAVRSSTSGNHSSQESVIASTVLSPKDARAEDSSSLSPEQTITNGHVIFPNHFKVPEALKSALSFGSFDTNFGAGSSSNDNGCNINSVDASESSHGTDEISGEPSLSNQSTAVLVDHPDQSESPQQVFDELCKSDGNVVLTVESKSDKSTQQILLLPEGHRHPAVHIAPNYGFGFVPQMQGGHFIQFEGHETQSEIPTASSGPSPSLSPTPVQNSVAASPQPLLFRPPYPPNYFPYGHYFNPYFLPPMHQFLSHNGLPQQPSGGNPYLTSASPAAGLKFPVPQLKPGTSTGNSTTIGIQTSYGSFGSSPVGIKPGPAVTSGSNASNEDLSASHLKESQIYTTGPLNDVSAWISPQSQDISSLHLNSLYHLTPQGQHLAFSHAQPGHSPFPGIYPQMQTISAPSTVNPLLQQSQALSATAETVGHPSGAYQQTQLAQMNWNSSY